MGEGELGGAREGELGRGEGRGKRGGGIGGEGGRGEGEGEGEWGRWDSGWK